MLIFLGLSLLLHGVWLWSSPSRSAAPPISSSLVVGLREFPVVEGAPQVPFSQDPAPPAPTHFPQAQQKARPQASPARPEAGGDPVETPAASPPPAAVTGGRFTSETASEASASLAPTAARAPAAGPEQGHPGAGGAGAEAAAAIESAGAISEAVPLAGQNPPPVYPRLALQRGWEGQVALRVRVSAGGDVEEVWVENSSGYPVLDQAALEAVKTWRFQPARQGVRAVAGGARIPIEFRLRGG